MVERLRVGVGIERGVGVFQVFQMRVIFKVQRGIEQSAELAKGRGLERGNVGLPAQESISSALRSGMKCSSAMRHLDGAHCRRDFEWRRAGK